MLVAIIIDRIPDKNVLIKLARSDRINTKNDILLVVGLLSSDSPEYAKRMSKDA